LAFALKSLLVKRASQVLEASHSRGVRAYLLSSKTRGSSSFGGVSSLLYSFSSSSAKEGNEDEGGMSG
jgi:hypothetical protein